MQAISFGLEAGTRALFAGLAADQWTESLELRHSNGRVRNYIRDLLQLARHLDAIYEVVLSEGLLTAPGQDEGPLFIVEYRSVTLLCYAEANTIVVFWMSRLFRPTIETGTCAPLN